MERFQALKASYEGVTHAGLAIVAADSTLVLVAQRAYDETDDPEVQETWEFPGGGLEPGEDPLAAAFREFAQEVGLPLPEGEVVNGWRAGPEDNYQGFVYLVDTAFDLSAFVPNGEVQNLAWIPPKAPRDMVLRPEMRDFDWTLLDARGVSGNEEEPMTEQSIEEPDLSMLDLAVEPIPVHGVLAPEDLESGDARGFNAGAMTARPYRLPFMWQERQTNGHDSAIVVGSVDRLMRKDGLIHWEGALMPTAAAGEFAELLAFFGRFGVSVDGDKGRLDTERAQATGVMWFDAVRAAGLTAVSIPAFSEAYVAFGPHPDMPEVDDEQMAVLRASGDVVEFAESFDRGAGWVTHPKETKRIHDYWTKKGQPGYSKIRWGTPGDFTRAKKLIGAKIGANSPEDLRYLNQIIAQWHHDALGYWPGELDKPGNKTSAQAKAEREAKASAEKWEEVLTAAGWTDVAEELFSEGIKSGRIKDVGLRDDGATLWELDGRFRIYSPQQRRDLAGKGQALPDGSYPIADVEDLKNAIQAIGRAKDPGKAKAHIKKRASALGETDLIPEDWSLTPAFTIDTLTASADTRVLPPSSYFERHEDAGALVIEEPDENGIRRTYGYAGEWGVCHIGFNGECVEVPEDPEGGTYNHYHLGRTKTNDEGYLNTGLITYKVEHRDAQTILSETPQQAHFDDISNAWAAVRIGEDDRGIWFSGVVLPHVSDDDLTLIEASGQVSGEWKHGAMRTLLTVGVPGFPVMRASAEFDDDGNVVALAASAFNTGECEPTPKERMQALAQADAEARFEAMRDQWEG